jgi:BlaI family penicillinase repressor
MKELTKAEDQIMQILWKLQKGFVKDIIEHLPEPKPAYNTVSTIVRILEKKGFVSHKPLGNSHEYYPLISKDEYKKTFIKSFVKKYFGDSFQEMVSFFASERDISLNELEDIKKSLAEEIHKQRAEEHD